MKRPKKKSSDSKKDKKSDEKKRNRKIYEMNRAIGLPDPGKFMPPEVIQKLESGYKVYEINPDPVEDVWAFGYVLNIAFQDLNRSRLSDVTVSSYIRS